MTAIDNQIQGARDTDAMDQIHAAMSGVEWSPDTLDAIAEIVTLSGREIIDPTEYEDEDKTEIYRGPIDTADQARQKAIEWQGWAGDQSLSYSEVAEWGSYFETLAERFPELAEEFRENAIIGKEPDEEGRHLLGPNPNPQPEPPYER